MRARQVAREHADAYCRETLGRPGCNMAFVHGHMEALERAGIRAGAFDLVISNCVVNLSPDKSAVLREAYRALAPGGEMYFSDVYCDRRLPEAARQNEVPGPTSAFYWLRCLPDIMHAACSLSSVLHGAQDASIVPWCCLTNRGFHVRQGLRGA
jgi:SAM-dependent methyltransferase